MSFEEIKMQIEEKWKEEIRVKIKEVNFSNFHQNILSIWSEYLIKVIRTFFTYQNYNNKNTALPCNRRRNTHDLQFGKLGYRWRASLAQVPRRLLFCSWASQWPSRPRRRRAWQRCTRSPWDRRWRPACTLRNCRRLRMCNRFLEVCAFQRRMTSKTDSIEVGMSCTLIA